MLEGDGLDGVASKRRRLWVDEPNCLVTVDPQLETFHEAGMCRVTLVPWPG